MDEMKPLIEIIAGQMRSQVEGGIYKAVQEYGISVDKERLLQALKDAKEFWHEGYKDGYRAAVWERPRWISVEERLPEASGEFLVFKHYRDGYNTIGTLSFCKAYTSLDLPVRGDYWIRYDSEYGDINMTDVVTHWLPLPEPPEVEG